MRRIARLLGTPLVAGLVLLGVAAPAGALQPYVFLSQWGTTGSGNSQFQDPSDVAVDPAGDVYVSDFQLGRVSKFDANGGFIKAWTRGCKICTFFNSPQSIAFGAGALWLADSGNQRLVKMDTNGAELLVVPTPAPGQPGHFGGALDIAVDRLGNVYATELLDPMVHMFSANGAFLADRATGASLSAGAVAVDDALNIYVTIAGPPLDVVTINRFGIISGVFRPTGASLGSPGISVDSQHRLYVSSGSPSVQVFSPAGVLLGQFGTAGTGPLQFNNPEAATPNATGIVYVVDRNNDRVQKVTETSTLVITVSDDVEPFPTPYSFTVANGPTPVLPFQLDDDPSSPLPGQRNITALVPGTYRVTISGGLNQLKSITCSNGQSVQNYGSDHIDVNVLAGQVVTCHFYEEWIG